MESDNQNRKKQTKRLLSIGKYAQQVIGREAETATFKGVSKTPNYEIMNLSRNGPLLRQKFTKAIKIRV